MVSVHHNCCVYPITYGDTYRKLTLRDVCRMTPLSIHTVPDWLFVTSWRDVMLFANLISHFHVNQYVVLFQLYMQIWILIKWHWQNNMLAKISCERLFQFIFLNENCCILFQISKSYMLKNPVNNKPALVHVMIWSDAFYHNWICYPSTVIIF